MKALKGLLTAVLALSMSTGFSGTVHANEQDTQTFYDRLLENDETSYEALAPESKEQIKAIIDRYCATGDLQAFQRSNQKLYKEMVSFDETYDEILFFSGIGFGAGVTGGMKQSFPIYMMGMGIVVAGFGTSLFFEKKEREYNRILTEQLNEACE